MKTILIDTSSLLYDCFFTNPLQPCEDLIQKLQTIQSRCQSTKVFFALDSSSLYKTQKYPFYKQKRTKKSKQLQQFFTQAIEYLKQQKYTLFYTKGYEADDIIASITHQQNQNEFIIVSKDKDFLQLLHPNVSLFDFKNDIFIYELNFKQVYNFEPHYFIDFQALFGDTIDGIKGVKGIGKKSALKLIQRFSTVESVYTNLHQIRNTKVKNALSFYKEDAFISKELALLKKDLHLTPLQP